MPSIYIERQPNGQYLAHDEAGAIVWHATQTGAAGLSRAVRPGATVMVGRRGKSSTGRTSMSDEAWRNDGHERYTVFLEGFEEQTKDFGLSVEVAFHRIMKLCDYEFSLNVAGPITFSLLGSERTLSLACAKSG